MKTTLRLATLLLGLTPLVAGAQTFQEYLRLRKQHKVTQPMTINQVNAIVGKKVVEVKGTVKGVIGSGETEMLMLVGANGDQLFVASQGSPDWLKTGSVGARLLIEADRDSETALLRAKFIGAASEVEVAETEAKAAPAPRDPRATVNPSRATTTRTPRVKGRPAPMPGEVPKTTTNPIGQPKENIGADLLAVLPAYTSFVKNWNKKLSDAEAQKIAESILAFSAHFGVDARLIVAIVITESDFNPKTRSHAGAMGLGQLMPSTAKSLGVTDPYDIEQNLWGTIRKVRGQLDMYSTKTEDPFEALVLSLAGYNAGNGAVRKHGGVPPYRETQNYVRKVIARYAQLCGKQ